MATTTTTTKLRARADALEEQARALRLAAYFLDEEAGERKRGTLGRTLSGAIALRAAQRNGHGPEVEEAPAKPARRLKRQKRQTRQQREAPRASFKATLARREKKRARILAIVRAHGKPMPIADLIEAAHAQGIGALTGLSGTVRAGYLKETGSGGKRYYSVPASAGNRPA